MLIFLHKLAVSLNYFLLILIYLFLVSIFTAVNKDKPLIILGLILYYQLILKYSSYEKQITFMWNVFLGFR